MVNENAASEGKMKEKKMVKLESRTQSDRNLKARDVLTF